VRRVSLSGANRYPGAMAEQTWAVPLSDVVADEELLQAVRDAVVSGWWSMGPRVAEFEHEFANLTGTAHALAVANGTAALQLSLLAIGCGPGDEVILPSLNFVAAANAISHTGAQPVFCDIGGERDLNLAPADVEAALTPATKAILILHYGGFPCDVAALLELARTRNIAVVEDAAHAPGARVGERACGSFGIAGCFSFFANKNLAMGEGGMITTDDDDVAARLRLLRSHGMTTLTWDRHRGHASSYDVLERGFNYRLDELRAAIGSVQLGRLAAGNQHRRDHWRRYSKQLDGVEGLIVPEFGGADGVTPSYHLAVVVLPEGVDRDAVRAGLARSGIQTSVHYPPIHGFSTYRTNAGRSLPQTEQVALRLLTLPLYPHMTTEQVDLVCRELLEQLRSVATAPAAVESAALAARQVRGG
jgi:dTDP-4-amino-4,6-dideoxygalactose transaminase